jgi:type I restriction enzyme, S subunit
VIDNGWQEIQLKDVAKPISRSVRVEAGISYRTIGVKWWGMGAYERETIDGSRTAAKTLSIVREGDLIINKIWVRHGSVAIATKEVDGCAGSGEFPTFELDLDSIDPRWIHWQTKMKSFWEKCDTLSRGTSGKNRIKPDLFLTIKIPLPPLMDQQRILARIDSLSTCIAEARSLRKDAYNASQALLLSVREKAFSTIEKRKPFGEILVFSAGGAWGDSDDSKGTAVLRPNNISFFGELVLGNIKYRSVPERDVRKSKLVDGDIIMTKSNSLELVGNSAIFNQPLNNPRIFIPSNFLQHLRVNLSMFDAKFIWYYIMSPTAKSYFQNNAIGTSPSLQNLNGTKISNMPVPVVALEEQQRLVAYLDGLQVRVSALRAKQSETEKELSALMPSILDKAFKGEL